MSALPADPRHCIDVRQGKSAAEMRDSIVALEGVMREMPQIEIPIEHFFAPGLYLRQMTMPKDSVITGKIHKTEHYCILAQGEVTLVTERGRERIRAPKVIHSMPGAKRAIHAHEETVWVNCHHNPTHERDPEKVEALFVTESFHDYYLQSDRTFERALEMIGITPEESSAVSEREDDQISVEYPNVLIADSPIHGKGVFAATGIWGGSFIAPARIAGKRTPAGRYCNHGAKPNAEMRMRENGDVMLVSLRGIAKGEEILTDYYLNFSNTRVTQLEGGK